MASDKNDKGNPNFLAEWQTARNILSSFDDRLHDLRKYGFSFITGLLVAQSFLLPSQLLEQPEISKTEILPDLIKLGVLIVNLILIVVLQLVDRNYRVFQLAAATRARVLERALDLELTEVISQRYRDSGVQWVVTAVYSLFVVGVGVLGGFVLYPNHPFIAFLAVAVFLAILTPGLFMIKSVTVHYPCGKIDWTLDRVQCTSGDEVGITLTNLGEEDILFEGDEIAWKIIKEDDGSAVANGEAKGPVCISPGDSFTWLWKTEGVKGDVYRIWRAVRIGEKHPPDLQPLRKKLRIRDKPAETREKPFRVALVPEDKGKPPVK